MLGHFQLTARLFPALEAAGAARVINVTSRGHRDGNVDFDNINYEDESKYDPMGAYAQSETALILFTLKLDEIGQKYGVRAFAVHPGPIPSTDLFAASRVNIGSDFEVSALRFAFRFMRETNLTALINAIKRWNDEGDAFKNLKKVALATFPLLTVSQKIDILLTMGTVFRRYYLLALIGGI
jgi:NAD(P)-dependent dehydrogenase (short-subunit alcohol dehydrogenase family)